MAQPEVQTFPRRALSAWGAAGPKLPGHVRPGRAPWRYFSSMARGHLRSPPDEIVLGRMTRAFDNRQGISDPRVSRQHLRISLLNDFAPAQPAGVARVLGLGHNPPRSAVPTLQRIRESSRASS